MRQMEQMAPSISAELIDQLRDGLGDLLRDLTSKLTDDESLQAWRLSYSIWKSCEAVSKEISFTTEAHNLARLLTLTCHFLNIAGHRDEVDCALFKFEALYIEPVPCGVRWTGLIRLKCGSFRQTYWF